MSAEVILDETNKETIKKLQDNWHKNIDDLDKTVITISSLAIGLIVGFLKELKPLIHASVYLQTTLIIAIGCFIMALILNAVGNKYGAYISYQWQLSFTQDIDTVGQYKIQKIIDMAYFLFFVSGLITLFVFISLMLFTTTI